MTITRHDVGPRMSQAVEYGNLVFLAGQVASDPSADVKGQTQQILDNIDKLLAECGSNKSKLLSAQIWLSDIGTFADMNSVWDAWIDPENPPCRACVESKLAAPQFVVEIMVTAGK